MQPQDKKKLSFDQPSDSDVSEVNPNESANKKASLEVVNNNDQTVNSDTENSNTKELKKNSTEQADVTTDSGDKTVHETDTTVPTKEVVENIDEPKEKGSRVFSKVLKSKSKRDKTKPAKKVVETGDAENKKPMSKVVKYSIIGTACIGVSFGAIFAYPLLKNAPMADLVNFGNSEGKTPQLQTFNEVTQLKQQLQDMESTLGDVQRQLGESMKLQQSVELLEKQIDSLKSQISTAEAAWTAASVERSNQINSIMGKLAALESFDDKVDPAQMKKLAAEIDQIRQANDKDVSALQKKYIELHDAFSKLGTVKEEIKGKAAKKIVSPKVEKARANQEKEVTAIGHLHLEGIQNFGTQNVGQVTDGVSGTIQVIAGDYLGIYQVTDVTAEGIRFKAPSGELFFLVKGV